MEDGDGAIKWLRRYRELRRRRDNLIRWAFDGGKTISQIARASGMSKQRVSEILGADARINESVRKADADA